MYKSVLFSKEKYQNIITIHETLFTTTTVN